MWLTRRNSSSARARYSRPLAVQSRIILRKEYQVRYRLERVMDLVIRPVEATLQSVWSEYLR